MSTTTVSGVEVQYLGNKLKIDALGNLFVISVTPTIPEGSVSASTRAVGNVTNGTPVDTRVIITTGKYLTIQIAEAGAQVNFKADQSSKVEYFWDPNGNGTGMQLIESVYSAGQTVQLNVNETLPLPGDGTRSLRMRRTSFGGTNEIYGEWKGYEQ